MSLISAKNLVAPLKNKVHIVTIILCAIAFAVLRMSGAGFSTSERRGYNPNRTHQVDNFGQRNMDQRNFDQQRQGQTSKKPDDNQALFDIEKELGL